jgi:iron(III) transport system substrate-binding protein
MTNRALRTHRNHRVSRHIVGIAATALAGLVVAACAPSSGSGAAPATGSPSSAAVTVDKDFSLDKLIAAAKKEGSVTVYDSSGDVTEVAKAFTAKYGIKATGVKSKVGDTLQKMTREAQAGNVTIDATFYEDGPSLVSQLLPQKVVETWVPADLAADLPSQNPLVVLQKADVWVYNTKLFPGGCPVKNVWDLVSAKWRGKVSLQDPLGKPNLIQYFTQLTRAGDAQLKSAYQDETGKPYAGSESDAGKEWVKELAKNKPILTTADEDVAAAVASPNQTQPRIGLMSVSKFRDIEDKGYPMATCATMKPWAGFEYPKYAAIATHAKHPNAAKLFVRFALTKEGILPEAADGGGISGNSSVGQLGDSPKGLSDWNSQLFVYDSKYLLDDARDAQDMQDFWRLNHT